MGNYLSSHHEITPEHTDVQKKPESETNVDLDINASSIDIMNKLYSIASDIQNDVSTGECLEVQLKTRSNFYTIKLEKKTQRWNVFSAFNVYYDETDVETDNDTSNTSNGADLESEDQMVNNTVYCTTLHFLESDLLISLSIPMLIL